MSMFSGIECDKCGKTVSWYGSATNKDLTRRARANGWTVGKRWLCPNCKKSMKAALEGGAK